MPLWATSVATSSKPKTAAIHTCLPMSHTSLACASRCRPAHRHTHPPCEHKPAQQCAHND
jgi:hypothetical protein